MKMKRNAGFTIIEMLIVVTILAMLAGILIPVLDDAGESAREARRQSDLKNVQAALESHRRTNGLYPDTADAWQGDMTDNGGFGYDAAGYIPGLVPDFLPSLPKDPDGQYPTASEGYMYRSDGINYKFVLLGTPENFDAGNPYLDPARADSWQISSPGAYNW
jgi:prepilin-type N-terminal cleavage/methylation domain-containing protein